jgi:hypothetical protein
LLVDVLAEQVAADRYGERDHSHIWRPQLKAGRRGDLRDQLVTAVHYAAAALVAADEEKLGDVVATLEARDFSIFRRLALDLLALHPNAELVAARLTDEDLFDDPAYEREYTALAREQFRELAPEHQATVLGWVDAAPHFEADEQRRRQWQRHKLERLGRPLPDAWQARYQALAGEATPEPEQVPEEGFVGPRSPLGQAELAAMSVTEIVALLREWEPDDGWRAPTPEGLAHVLRQVIAADPERFAAKAMAFVDLDPTYVRALLGGLRDAKQNSVSFPWPAVLDLANAIPDKPREIQGRDPRAMELDPGWTWTWQESLHLLREGFNDGEGKIGKEHKKLVWNVIARHADDANPAPEDEQENDGFGPVILALNSIRGAAMHAAFHYGWWLRGDEPERRLPAELAALLERRLDPTVEQTAAIRSVYGQWFPLLVTCDQAWAQAHADLIFAREDEERLWRAAWHAYVRSNRASQNVYRVLTAQYRRGIEELEAPVGGDGLLGEVSEAVVTHLMSLYAQGLIAFGDEGGLLDRFYEVASVERRAEALESIGRGVMGDTALSEAVAARLRALLERRLEAVREGGDGEELRGYAWWFASGKFDAAWSLAQLRALLQAGGRVHPDHLVAGHLSALRGEFPLEVVRTLELMIETGTRPWFVLGAREDITAILTDALAAGGEVETRARDMVNRLIARGFGEFGGLLPS